MNEVDILSVIGEISTTALFFYAWMRQMNSDQSHIERLVSIIERMALDDKITAVAPPSPEKKSAALTAGAAATLLVISILSVLG